MTIISTLSAGEIKIKDLEVDSELISAYPDPGPPDQLGYNINKTWTTNHT